MNIQEESLIRKRSIKHLDLKVKSSHSNTPVKQSPINSRLTNSISINFETSLSPLTTMKNVYTPLRHMHSNSESQQCFNNDQTSLAKPKPKVANMRSQINSTISNQMNGRDNRGGPPRKL